MTQYDLKRTESDLPNSGKRLLSPFHATKVTKVEPRPNRQPQSRTPEEVRGTFVPGLCISDTKDLRNIHHETKSQKIALCERALPPSLP